MPPLHAGEPSQSLDETLWRDIPKFYGYQVHPSGIVRSRRKTGRRPKGKAQLNPDWVMKGQIQNGHGYCVTGLGYKTLRLTHRLVGLVFIPNPENKPHINHKNGIKNDNRVENLEWVTQKENITHSRNVLGNKRDGEANNWARITRATAMQIIAERKERGMTMRALANKHGMSVTGVFHIIHANTWKHLPR